MKHVKWHTHCSVASSPPGLSTVMVGPDIATVHFHKVGISPRLGKLRQVLYYASHGHVYDITKHAQTLVDWLLSGDSESMFLATLQADDCYVGEQVPA